MRSRDFSVASTMTNPFLVQAAESCAEERAVAENAQGEEVAGNFSE